MRMPNIKPIAQYKTCIDAFNGYYHNIRCGEDKLYDITNMTLDKYPTIATREKYKEVFSMDMEPTETKSVIFNGMITYGDEFLVTVGETDGDLEPYTSNKLAVYHAVQDEDDETELELMHEFSLGTGGAHAAVDRQLSIMGGYLIIMPDQLYMRVSDPNDNGSFEMPKIEGEVVVDLPQISQVMLCDPSGTQLTPSEYAPASPSAGDYWVKQIGGEYITKTYSNNAWVIVPTRFRCQSFEEAYDSNWNLKPGDIVHFDGLDLDATIYRMTADPYVIFEAKLTTLSATNDLIRFMGKKDLPASFVFECGNRLWGCRFFEQDGRLYDEIFCSPLGDFQHWEYYPGTSMSSWTATRPGDGPYTGAINYNGTPLFFKEKSLTKVVGTEPSNFAVTEYTCDGVMRGCAKSLAIVNGSLFYRSIHGISVYDGSLPRDISDAFCGLLDTNADSFMALTVSYGAALNNKYYVSTEAGFFVYDAKKGLWTRFNAPSMLHGLCAYKTALFSCGLRTVTSGNTSHTYTKIHLVAGHVPWTMTDVAIDKWSMETGYIFATKSKYSNHTADRLYLSKITVRASFTGGVNDTFKMYVSYDDANWEECVSLTPCIIKSKTIHFVPKRVDRLRLKFEGSGSAEILSITKTVERGSDVTW